VNIEPISIDTTAAPGAGNLLGNLLCAVAGLLEPSSALADFLGDLLSCSEFRRVSVEPHRKGAGHYGPSPAFYA
jgi:hypothetical protein